MDPMEPMEPMDPMEPMEPMEPIEPSPAPRQRSGILHTPDNPRKDARATFRILRETPGHPRKDARAPSPPSAFEPL